ncbi:MCE family protein [Actinomadura montaniterrae]|uniref:MCE family protein n=1 Tax=Actinomadura montaniterrae TaxID=1803903 RepID=A0A6L3VZQ4_9ACTN|nr:MCE family protein [Actinomadura montaniterrae]KAB2388009.1 MCE family protein [Actinomadura montaniterrae]
MMRRLVPALAALVLAATTGGCTVTGDGGTYKLTVYFAKTPSLYERSRVKVMGADSGTITSIKDEQTRVRVDLAVKRSVPVPDGVHAAIASDNALGERYVLLHPVWKPGMRRAAPGAVIPQSRTELPVEIDEALDAFAKLNRSIDPKQLGSALHRGADGLRGHGGDINVALGATSRLTGDLAAQDRQIVSLARNLRAVAASLNGRDEQLSQLIASFSTTSGTLSAERTKLRDFVAGLAAAIRKSDVLITDYRETLPSTVADLSNIVLTLKGNARGLNQAIQGLGRFADVAVKAWNRKQHVATIRVLVHATLRTWLQPLFTAMGWGTVPCVPDNPALGNCVPNGKAGK